MDITTICKDDGKTVSLTQRGVSYTLQPIITCNKKMLDQIAVLDSVSSTDLSVLVIGETGTIKEKYTEYIHKNSKRAEKPYVRFDCEATSASAYSMELFGSQNDRYDRQGIFQTASGGTVLLDGISAIPFDCQQELTQFIDSGVISKGCSNIPIFSDVRFLSISNTDIVTHISENKYVARLYGALSSVKIDVLPLRSRPEDIALLSLAYLDSTNKKYGVHRLLGLNLFNAMLEYNWPGNEKELIELMERLSIMSRCDILDDVELFTNLNTSYCEQALPAQVNAEYEQLPFEQRSMSLREMVKDYELMVIRQSIQKYKTLRKAAKALNVSPSILSRKLAAAREDISSN